MSLYSSSARFLSARGDLCPKLAQPGLPLLRSLWRARLIGELTLDSLLSSGSGLGLRSSLPQLHSMGAEKLLLLPVEWSDQIRPTDAPAAQGLPCRLVLPDQLAA